VSSSPVFVFTAKASFMQRIADLVRVGHVRYVQGEVAPVRASALYAKFSKLYEVHASDLQGLRIRKKGNATARLLFLHSESSEKLLWILLARNGDFVSGQSEAWKDYRAARITVTGYELVRLTKPQEPKPVFTWRYNKDREAELRNAIVMYIRTKNDRKLEDLIAVIARSPGFAGVRDQVKKMFDLVRTEWLRVRKSSESLPAIPARIGYVRRLKDKGMTLDKLIKNQET